MGCIDGCGSGEYKTVQYGDYTFDCQTIAEKLGKHHTKAMAGRKQKWLRTTCNRFDIQMIRGRIETKQKHIEDAEERNRTIKQEYEDFLEDYGCIVFGHWVFDNNRSMLDRTQNNERAWSAQIRIDKENLPVVI
jgi:hypothetical protein